MKLMLISENQYIKTLLCDHLEPLGICIIHYTHPIKGMDNLLEVDPELIIFNAEDFPRHWKPLLSLLREIHSKEDVPLVLIHNCRFSYQEAAKASHLGVSGIIEDGENPDQLIEGIIETIVRLKGLSENRRIRRYVPKPYDELSFIFTHPEHHNLIPGSIKEISADSLSFAPDEPVNTRTIPEGTVLQICSLRIGGRTFSIECTVVRNHQTMVLRLHSVDIEMKKTLTDYVNSSAERSIKFQSSPLPDPTAKTLEY